MAQIQINISNTSGTSTSASGQVTDPAVIAAALQILTALTTAATVPAPEAAP